MAGWAAVAFVAAVLTINVVENVVTARPDPGVPVDEVVSWAVDAGPHLWSSTLLVPVAWVLLAIVVVAVWDRARSVEGGAFFPALAAIGSAMTMGTLSAAIAADAVLISRVGELSPSAIEVLSGLATALFVMNWAALAVALFGLSRTVWRLGMIRPWLGRTSLVGSGLLLVGAVQTAPAFEGVLVGLLVGLAGFVIWLLFLVVVGIRLIRSPA